MLRPKRIRRLVPWALPLSIWLGAAMACSGSGGGGGSGSASSLEVVGRWQEVDEPEETLEFFEDGRVAISDQDGTVEGRWEETSGGTIRIEATLFGMSAEMTGRLDGDDFHLEADGRTTVYQRRP